MNAVLLAENNRLDRESNDYKYTSLGIHFVESDKSGFAVNLSIDLPGVFYATLERKADGVDYKKESYDKVIDTARLGVHIGIGDLIGNISSGDVSFKIKNQVQSKINCKQLDLINPEQNIDYEEF